MIVCSDSHGNWLKCPKPSLISMCRDSGMQRPHHGVATVWIANHSERPTEVSSVEAGVGSMQACRLAAASTANGVSITVWTTMHGAVRARGGIQRWHACR